MTKRIALFIANDKYNEQQFNKLLAPRKDARELAYLLENKKIGGFEVEIAYNEHSSIVNPKIEDFFTNSLSSDFLLFYFSGHGIRDEDGSLYLATPDTKSHTPLTTSIPASHLKKFMLRSGAPRTQLILLDCCFSGAIGDEFLNKKGENVVGIDAHLGRGKGQVIMTSSNSIQYSLDGQKISEEVNDSDHKQYELSLFTSAIVQGIKTGNADIDEDGFISHKDLEEYVDTYVKSQTNVQTPKTWVFGTEGKMIIAQSPIIKPLPLPENLIEKLNQYELRIRMLALRDLERMLDDEDKRRTLAALNELKRLTSDDSKAVSARAESILKNHSPLSESVATPKKTLSINIDATRRNRPNGKKQLNSPRQKRKKEQSKETDSIRKLSLINPIDYLRLIWWVFMKPSTYKRFKDNIQEDQSESLIIQSIRLAATLSWGFIILFAIIAWGKNISLYGFAFLLIVISFVCWMLVMLFGILLDNNELSGLICSIVAFYIAFVVSAIALPMEFLAYSIPFLGIIISIFLSTIIIVSQKIVLEVEVEEIAWIGWGIALGITAGTIPILLGGGAIEAIIVLLLPIIIGTEIMILTEKNLTFGAKALFGTGSVILFALFGLILASPLYFSSVILYSDNVATSLLSIVTCYILIVIVSVFIILTYKNYSDDLSNFLDSLHSN